MKPIDRITTILAGFQEETRGNVWDRFCEYISPEPNTGCWLWSGGGNRYGAFWASGRFISAHRFAFQAQKGPVPEGLQLDHLCRVTCCVNPDHLEAVTCQENSRRKPDHPNQYRSRTHCKHGHLLAGDNVRRGPGGERICRTCNSARVNAWKKARRHAS